MAVLLFQLLRLTVFSFHLQAPYNPITPLIFQMEAIN